MKLFYDLNKNKHGKCGKRRRKGKIAASDRSIDRSLRSTIPRIECDEMAMIPIRVYYCVYRDLRLIFHRSIIKCASLTSRFHTIRFSLESSSQLARLPFLRFRKKKFVSSPFFSSYFFLHPLILAYVWTFYDPQTDLTNDKRTKTVSFPLPFDVHTYPDYDLPKPPVRHNHLLDHKLSPLLLSPCFCLSCVCPPRLATPRLRLIDIQRGRGEGVGSIDRFNRRISKRGVKGSPLVAPIPRRAREKPSLHVSRYSVPRCAYGRLSPA